MWENLKETLTAAHLFGSDKLKQACFEFVIDNWEEALTHPDFVALAAEDPELWGELTATIRAMRNMPASKRARTT
eukprot:scaffold1380_cov161-Amphora_coffeaeformis.AAC.6